MAGWKVKQAAALMSVLRRKIGRNIPAGAAGKLHGKATDSGVA
jgi:hypothetical protein